MRLRQIEDVNVIADARTVRSRVVGAVNLHCVPLPERHPENIRNQMGLDAMIFPIFFGRAGRIEVTQRDILETVDLIVPSQHLFK